MIAVNSNCSRIDAVKASANQLKIQFSKPPGVMNGSSPQLKAVENDLQALDVSIRTGDAKKAELALSAAESAVRKLDSTSAATDRGGPGQSLSPVQRLDVYA